MPKLNAQQARELAGNFLSLAQSVGDYRLDNFSTLSKPDLKRLGELQSTLLRSGEDMLALSATLVLPEVQQSLKDLGAVTKDIRTTITRLKSVQKVLNVAAAAVSLSSSIISKNPQAIVSGIQGLISSWKA